MNRRPGRPFFLASAAVLVSLAARPSRADPAGVTKEACVEANARGQDLRREGKLAAAREQLRACAVPACPAIVQDDCTRRLDEVDRVQPSVVFDVKDASGADVIDVRVLADGQPLAERLSGGSLSVDPGAHEFAFDAPGHPTTNLRLLIKEGEAGRRERVVLESPAPPPPPLVTAPPPVVTAPPPPAAATGGLGAPRVAALMLGGAGVASVGLGVAFGLLAGSAWSKAKTACGGNPGQCTDVAAGASYRSTTETDAAVSTVGFVAGGALIAAGAVVFFALGPRDAHGAARLVVAPSAAPGHAGLAVAGAFP